MRIRGGTIMNPFLSIFAIHSFLGNLMSSPHHVTTSLNGSPPILLNNHRVGKHVQYSHVNGNGSNPLPYFGIGKNPSNVTVVVNEVEGFFKNMSADTFWRLFHMRPVPETSLAYSNQELGSSDPIYIDLEGSNITFPKPTIYHVEFKTAYVDGLRLESVEKGVTYESSGASVILADVPTSIRIFGKAFTNNTMIRFATETKNRGEDCDDTSATRSYYLSEISPNALSAVVQVTFPASHKEEFYLICVRENDTDMPWVHQGPDPWLMIKAYERLLPFWVQAVCICILLLISGLFAGLTLGLLALDRTDLKILANTGSEEERLYAKTILPLRSRGNYLLCSLVLGNVLVNSTLTILLDDLTSGLLAVIFATVGIVIFGEIIPQAVCSRNGLAIGAKTVWVTKFLMFITFPLSYTISIILDKILGEEIGLVYNREKLKELIAVTLEYNDLEAEEVNIISGALSLKKKTVEDIMTRLEDVFMLPINGVLDFELQSEIRKQGYSRIPIYDGDRSKIVSLLFTKDLVFVDPDDKVSIECLTKFYTNPCFFVFADTKLDVVFKEFKDCHRGHMAFVQKINIGKQDQDPFCETIGLVTLEDVIEELIQSEIVDETDVWLDNRSKKRITPNKKQDFSKFVEIRNSQKTICISPQLALAAFQFLTTVVEPFKTSIVSDTVLHRLLKKNILLRIKVPKDSKSKYFLYENGKPTDTFTLVLEGRVEVLAGKENLIFQTGIFTYFGVPALMSGAGDPLFVPDYTVKPIPDVEVVILRVKRTLYHAAIQATVLEKRKVIHDSNGTEINVDPTIDEQIENVLKTVDTENQIQLEGQNFQTSGSVLFMQDDPCTSSSYVQNSEPTDSNN